MSDNYLNTLGNSWKHCWNCLSYELSFSMRASEVVHQIFASPYKYTWEGEIKDFSLVFNNATIPYPDSHWMGEWNFILIDIPGVLKHISNKNMHIFCQPPTWPPWRKGRGSGWRPKYIFSHRPPRNLVMSQTWPLTHFGWLYVMESLYILNELVGKKW